MVFDTSGSPVIYKERGKDAVHGLHGNGMDLMVICMNNYNCFKLKKWIQNENISLDQPKRHDGCSLSGRKSFMTGEEFENRTTFDCGKTILDYVQPVSCKLIDQSKADKLPNF